MCAVQYFTVARALETEQVKYDAMPAKMSKIRLALTESAEELNQIGREHERQVSG